jgi:hypothetical protein
LGSRDFDYPGPDSVTRELAATVPALADAARPKSTARPPFVAETSGSVRRLLPVLAGSPTSGAEVAETRSVNDSYRGLDLAREIKGLNMLRAKMEGRHG